MALCSLPGSSWSKECKAFHAFWPGHLPWLCKGWEATCGLISALPVATVCWALKNILWKIIQQQLAHRLHAKQTQAAADSALCATDHSTGALVHPPVWEPEAQYALRWSHGHWVSPEWSQKPGLFHSGEQSAPLLRCLTNMKRSLEREDKEKYSTQRGQALEWEE